jgi:Mn-dependent DtxR family transcriptional regulator
VNAEPCDRTCGMGVTAFLTRRPQTKRELAARMGIPQRSVEAAVNEARHQGRAIMSDSDGYWLTDDPEEVAAMAARLHKRSTHVHETARALEATAERMARAQAGAEQLTWVAP